MKIDMRALQVMDKIFKEHDITYWLDCGTLLGAIREGKYIEWDGDIDISIFFKDVLRVYMLQKEFKKYGYEFRGLPKPGICKDKDHLICIIAAKIQDGKLVQMFGWNSVTKLVYLMSRHLKLGLIRQPLFLLSVLIAAPRLKWGEYKWLGNFAYVKMCGDYYPIPEHVEEYLEYRYSSNWRTPIKGIPWLKMERAINLQRWHGEDEKAYVFKEKSE
ncbi:unnamed protein product [marine sediment metagenome]|uniref:LicD/FKTN/FKRP nucleotidyltransferase domain-containing protein n=1 Tax=marine sediment metagenome TaxID=412755 RepID=X1D3J8_9ZZZZ